MTLNQLEYALALMTGVAVAVWWGVPPIFLLLLGGPILVMFMMGGLRPERVSSRGGHWAGPSTPSASSFGSTCPGADYLPETTIVLSGRRGR